MGSPGGCSDYTVRFCCAVDVPVDGNWSNWGEFGECDTRDNYWGDGVKTRTRTCTNPAPEFGGADCVGDDAETEPCTVTCKNAYTYGSDVLVRGCPAPKCDS